MKKNKYKEYLSTKSLKYLKEYVKDNEKGKLEKPISKEKLKIIKLYIEKQEKDNNLFLKELIRHPLFDVVITRLSKKRKIEKVKLPSGTSQYIYKGENPLYDILKTFGDVVDTAHKKGKHKILKNFCGGNYNA